MERKGSSAFNLLLVAVLVAALVTSSESIILPCLGLHPTVDFSASDDSTVDPPTILLRKGEFETFLVEFPEELALTDVTLENWDNITFVLSVPDASVSAMISETLLRSINDARNADRIGVQDAADLGADFTFVGGTVVAGSRDYTVQRDAPANLTHVLLTLRYEYGGGVDPPEFRHVYMRINFNDGCGSQDIDITIRYIGENERAPVVNITDAIATFKEGSFDPISVTNGSLVVGDDDTSFFLIKSATVTITRHTGADISEEELATTETSHYISASYNPSTGVLTLTGDASPLEYTRVLNGVTYFNGARDIGFDQRTVTFTVFDDDFFGSNTVVIWPINVNDPPVIRLDGNRTTTLNYTEGTGPTGINANLTASDPDDVTLDGTIVILCGAVPGDEIVFGEELPDGVNRSAASYVSFCVPNVTHNENDTFAANESCLVPAHGVCGSSSNATIFELHGSASVEDYERLLQSIQYFNTRRPGLFFPHYKTIILMTWDGELFSAPVYIKIKFIPVNDGPILQFSPTADPTKFAPPENRHHMVGFTEEQNPVLIFPRTTTLVDVDSSYAYKLKIWLEGTVVNETLLWNMTMASQLGLVVEKSGYMWTFKGMVSFYKLKKFLLTFMYENLDHTEPVEGVRTVIAIVCDAEMAESRNVTIYIDVETRNDRPDLDLGVGENVNDNTTFTEVEVNSGDVGIHIASLPHRIMISDEVEEMHYTTKVTLKLRARACGELDPNEELIYLLGPVPDEINYDPALDGRSVTATTTDIPDNAADIEALTEAYEQWLFGMRYIHVGNEPTLYCPGDTHTPLYRYVEITIFDSGDPIKNRTVVTRITIIPVNDQAPKVTVDVDGDCLASISNGPALNFFNGLGNGGIGKKKKRDTKNEVKTELPQVLSVGAYGNGLKGFGAGAQVMVKFSVDTNTPVVMRPRDLMRVVELSPSSLHELPHIGVWLDSKTLQITFPVMDKTRVNMTMADELRIAFPTPPEKCSDPDNPICGCICDSSGRSCGIAGTYGVHGQVDIKKDPILETQQDEIVSVTDVDDTKNDERKQPAKLDVHFEESDSDDVEQTQLHDWLLITLAFVSFVIAIVTVLAASCRKKKTATGKSKLPE